MAHTTTYRSEIDKLTERAKTKSFDGLGIGERFYTELLNKYIYQYRTNAITADELKKLKQELDDRLMIYWDTERMFQKCLQNRIKACELKPKIYKAETVEEITDNALKLIELLLDEEGFYHRIQKKINDLGGSKD